MRAAFVEAKDLGKREPAVGTTEQRGFPSSQSSGIAGRMADSSHTPKKQDDESV